MRRKVPSTTSLVVFESAARHESFARAAMELSLTESAVSRQIASLENYLGMKLFARVKKQVVLNEPGRVYMNNVSKFLSDIEAQTLSIMANKGHSTVLELAVLPTLANRWLIPRLRDFQLNHPDITVHITEMPRPFLFQDTKFDAALHFEHPSWTGVIKADLFEESLVPVVNPSFFEVDKLKSAKDLLALPLLHKSTRPEAWLHWFEQSGCTEDSAVLGLRFDMYGMVIEAARAGLGAGLVPRFYVHDEIERGDLVIPVDIELRHEKRYCFVYPEHKADAPRIIAFRDWLLETRQVDKDHHRSHQCARHRTRLTL